jgi:hypothetical protein
LLDTVGLGAIGVGDVLADPAVGVAPVLLGAVAAVAGDAVEETADPAFQVLTEVGCHRFLLAAARPHRRPPPADLPLYPCRKISAPQ